MVKLRVKDSGAGPTSAAAGREKEETYHSLGPELYIGEETSVISLSIVSSC